MTAENEKAQSVFPPISLVAISDCGLLPQADFDFNVHRKEVDDPADRRHQ